MLTECGRYIAVVSAGEKAKNAAPKSIYIDSSLAITIICGAGRPSAMNKIN
jgi:hypothetical protein